MALPFSTLSAPPAASVETRVIVDPDDASDPFNVPRVLSVPPDFRISVLARIPGARFMAVAPNGDLLVSQPSSGRIKLIRMQGSDAVVSDFAAGLRYPHDIVFHAIGSQTFVYVGESHQISRYTYTTGDTTAGVKQVVVGDLPDASDPELKGTYGHQLKNIAVDRVHNLYVSIASATNASVSDTLGDPVRCAIYRYDFQEATSEDQPYRSGRLVSRGLRNAEGLAFVPGTDDLWAVVNNRDNVPFPHHGDITGDGEDDYGRTIQSYVDNHPPEEFVHVREGANFGWPFANPNPDTSAGMDNMPFDPDYNNNPNWSVFPESAFTRVDKGIQAHSAPLGLSFLQDTGFPSAYRNGAVVALHGSWNRARKTGYKVIYFPWNSESGKPGEQMDLVSGWVNNATQQAWGRPVDAVADASGSLFISDNVAGAIYKLSYEGTPPPPPPPPDDELMVKSFSIVDSTNGLDIPGYEVLPGGSLTIDRASLPKRYSLRANTAGAVGSIVFSYNETTRYHTENKAPYCIKGDIGRTGAACRSWLDGMASGTHIVTATPYAERAGEGVPGKPLTLTLTVNAAVGTGTIDSFSLIDVATGMEVPGYEEIEGGLWTIDRASLPTAYSLRANASGPVGSVVFSYNDSPGYQTENFTPFCIRGDRNVDGASCLEWPEGMRVGTHNVTVTPYSGEKRTGEAGAPLNLILQIR